MELQAAHRTFLDNLVKPHKQARLDVIPRMDARLSSLFQPHSHPEALLRWFKGLCEATHKRNAAALRYLVEMLGGKHVGVLDKARRLDPDGVAAWKVARAQRSRAAAITRLQTFAARHGLEEDIAKLKPDAQEQVFMQTVRCAKKIKELEQQGQTVGSLRELDELDKGVRSQVRADRLREFAERHGLERDIVKL